MSYSIQLRSFQVRFTNGYLVQEDYINNIVLERIIETHDLSDISKISFYFEEGLTPFHSLIIRNTGINNEFKVDFYSYYNDNNQITELTKEEKNNDYTLVMSRLLPSEILKEKLIPNISLPSF